MKNFKALNYVSTDSYDTIGADVLMVRTDKNRYFLADAITGNLLTSGFSSETLAQIHLAKIEDRRARGNMMGFRFGSKATPKTLKGYAAVVWGDLFALKSIRFDGHYWWTKVVCAETGEVSESVRADYFINYLRIPALMETEAAVAVATARGARWED